MFIRRVVAIGILLAGLLAALGMFPYTTYAFVGPSSSPGGWPLQDYEYSGLLVLNQNVIGQIQSVSVSSRAGFVEISGTNHAGRPCRMILAPTWVLAAFAALVLVGWGAIELVHWKRVTSLQLASD